MLRQLRNQIPINILIEKFLKHPTKAKCSPLSIAVAGYPSSQKAPFRSLLRLNSCPVLPATEGKRQWQEGYKRPDCSFAGTMWGENDPFFSMVPRCIVLLDEIRLGRTCPIPVRGALGVAMAGGVRGRWSVRPGQPRTVAVFCRDETHSWASSK
jgi:hypothetical protein